MSVLKGQLRLHFCFSIIIALPIRYMWNMALSVSHFRRRVSTSLKVSSQSRNVFFLPFPILSMQSSWKCAPRINTRVLGWKVDHIHDVLISSVHGGQPGTRAALAFPRLQMRRRSLLGGVPSKAWSATMSSPWEAAAFCNGSAKICSPMQVLLELRGRCVQLNCGKRVERRSKEKGRRETPSCSSASSLPLLRVHVWCAGLRYSVPSSPRAF